MWSRGSECVHVHVNVHAYTCTSTCTLYVVNYTCMVFITNYLHVHCTFNLSLALFLCSQITPQFYSSLSILQYQQSVLQSVLNLMIVSSSSSLTLTAKQCLQQVIIIMMMMIIIITLYIYCMYCHTCSF